MLDTPFHAARRFRQPSQSPPLSRRVSSPGRDSALVEMRSRQARELVDDDDAGPARYPSSSQPRPVESQAEAKEPGGVAVSYDEMRRWLAGLGLGILAVEERLPGLQNPIRSGLLFAELHEILQGYAVEIKPAPRTFAEARENLIAALKGLGEDPRPSCSSCLPLCRSEVRGLIATQA